MSNLIDHVDTVKVAIVSFVLGANGNPVSVDHLQTIIPQLVPVSPEDVSLVVNDCVGHKIPGSTEAIKKAILTERSSGSRYQVLYFGTLNAPAWVYDVEFW